MRLGYEPEINAKGGRLIWLEARVVDRLTALRGPGESYSDVIVRLRGGRARITEWVLTCKPRRIRYSSDGDRVMF